MNHAPLISVIVPTYNRASLIESTLQSILGQSYFNLELIVIDDGSTDTTHEVVGKIKDPRMVYSVISHAGRPAVPRNVGMRAAKGDYIAFCDDDDLWMPQKLERQAAVLDAHKDLFMTCTNAEFLPDHSIMKKIGKNEIIRFENFIFNSDIVNSSVIIKRCVMDHIGYFDEDMRLKATEDYDYWCRLLAFQDRSVLFLKDVLVYYRMNSGNSISSLNINGIDDLYTRATIVHKKFAIKYPDLIKRVSMSFEHKRFVDRNNYKLFAGELHLKDIWKNTLLSISEKCRATIICNLFRVYKMCKIASGSKWKNVENILSKFFILAGINIRPYLLHFKKFY